MKTRVFLTRTILIATVIVGAALQSFAQQGPGGGRGGLLTQEQRSKLRDAMQPSQTQLTELNQKLATAQREAIKAALADNPDESVVRAKVEAVTKIQTDIAMLRFKGLKEIKSSLTDEQKSRMDERPGMGYMMLFGGFGGGGRRGPGAAGNGN
jgi:Spy/CpxP family protein refolding chaperone